MSVLTKAQAPITRTQIYTITLPKTLAHAHTHTDTRIFLPQLLAYIHKTIDLSVYLKITLRIFLELLDFRDHPIT